MGRIAFFLHRYMLDLCAKYIYQGRHGRFLAGKAGNVWSLSRFWEFESGCDGLVRRWSSSHCGCLTCQKSTVAALMLGNVRSVKKDTKRSSNKLLCLVSFFMERTLYCYVRTNNLRMHACLVLMLGWVNYLTLTFKSGYLDSSYLVLDWQKYKYL